MTIAISSFNKKFYGSIALATIGLGGIFIGPKVNPAPTIDPLQITTTSGSQSLSNACSGLGLAPSTPLSEWPTYNLPTTVRRNYNAANPKTKNRFIDAIHITIGTTLGTYNDIGTYNILARNIVETELTERAMEAAKRDLLPKLQTKFSQFLPVSVEKTLRYHYRNKIKALLDERIPDGNFVFCEETLAKEILKILKDQSFDDICISMEHSGNYGMYKATSLR